MEFRIAAWVTLPNALVSAGASIVRLFRADLVLRDGNLPDPACLVLAIHAAGSAMSLAAACAIAVRAGSPAALTALGAMAGLIQVMDAAAAALRRDLVATVVPAVLATLQCWAVALLSTPAPPGGLLGGCEPAMPTRAGATGHAVQGLGRPTAASIEGGG